MSLQPRPRNYVDLALAHVKFMLVTSLDWTESTPAKDCWIYLIEQVNHGASGEPRRRRGHPKAHWPQRPPEDRQGWTTLALTHELYATKGGRYRATNLDRDHGKYPRTLGSAEAKSVLLPIEVKGVSVWWYALCSPFQLPWSRLPPLKPFRVYHSKEDREDFETFWSWLQVRGLTGNFFTPELAGSEEGPWVARIKTPWLKAIALHDKFETSLDIFLRRSTEDELAAGRRYVHQIVTALTAEDRSLQKWIDQDELARVGGEIAALERMAKQSNRNGKALVSYLHESAFAAMMIDAEEADDEAMTRLLRCLALIFNRLPEAEGSGEFLEWFVEKRSKILGFAFKLGRKDFKTIFSLIKASAAAAAKLGEDPFRKKLISWFKDKIGADIEATVTGILRSKHINTVEELAHNPFLHKVTTLLDFCNCIFAFQSLKQSTDGRLQKSLALTSAVGGLSSTAFGMGELALESRAKKNITTWIDRLTPKGIFGLTGNTADAVASWMAAEDEFAEGDFDAGWGMRIAAFGAVLGAIGHVAAFFGALPLSAFLIGLGQFINLAGTVWFVLADDPEIAIWLQHSCFGTQRLTPTDKTTRWSEGSLTAFHDDVGKQVRALNAILFGFHVYWKQFPLGSLTPKPGTRHLVVSLKAMPPAATVQVGLQMRKDGAIKELRPFGPVMDGFQPSADGSARELWIEVPHADDITARVQLDLYGDGSMLYPAKDPLVSKYSFSLGDLLVLPNVTIWQP